MGKIVYFKFSYRIPKKKKKNQIYLGFSKKKKIENFFKFFFISRWWFLHKTEKNKKIYFRIIKNNGMIGNLNFLWKLKKLFEKHLPNIPKSYVTRLIFGKNYESLVIQKFKKTEFKIIGGCSYRLYKQQQIIELIFFAINTKRQTRGYGTYLMMMLKNYAAFLGLKYIITCADNNAVFFFSKQGFSSMITSPKLFWAGFINDYDEVTLMEFVIIQGLNYTNSCLSLLSKKILLLERTNGLLGKKKALNFKKLNFFNKKMFSFPKKFSEKREPECFTKKIKKFLNEIKINEYIYFFLEPFDVKLGSDKKYFHKAFEGIDLRTIEERLRFGVYYNNLENFFQDFEKIITNYQFYNGNTHFLSKFCLKIQILFLQLKKKVQNF